MLDKHFQSAIDFYKPAKKVLSHNQTVVRLYRHALRCIDSWAESREVFIDRAEELRNEFDSNKNVSLASAKRLIREGEERLFSMTHPDPYIKNYMPGGTLFMRNPAVAKKYVYPEGIPEGVDTRKYNVDFSRIPKGQEWANRVYIDSANKKYWIEEK
tara:strand:- start:16 stop:486 length:471 start_codon:yes stop_codon:yes gene_type:complete